MSRFFVNFFDDYGNVVFGIILSCIIVLVMWSVINTSCEQNNCNVTIEPSGVVVVPDGICGIYRCNVGGTLVQGTSRALVQVIRPDGSPVSCRVGVEL